MGLICICRQGSNNPGVTNPSYLAYWWHISITWLQLEHTSLEENGLLGELPRAIF